MRRLRRTRKNISPDKWSWIPGDENIADLPTRGTTIEKLNTDERWIFGLSWLKRPLEEWPVRRDVCAKGSEEEEKII